MCQPVGAIHESPVFSNGQNPNQTTVCHPERSRSFFERIARKNREPLGKRDLATTLGGFLMGCYIDSKATQICSEIPAVLCTLLLLVRFAQPAKVRLRSG